LKSISKNNYKVIKKEKRPSHLDYFFSKEIVNDFIKRSSEIKYIPFFNKNKILQYFKKKNIDSFAKNKMFFLGYITTLFGEKFFSLIKNFFQCINQAN